MSLQNPEVNSLRVSPIRKRHWWVLNEDWIYEDLIIPAGFTTDFDSVPHIPGIFALYKGRSRVAALIHDYLYTVELCSRKEADQRFLRYMVDDGIPSWIAKSMYIAVRALGWRYWQRTVGDTPKERFYNRLIDADGLPPCHKQ